MSYYNDTNTCDRCRDNGIIEILGSALKEKDKNGNWTGRWICNRCYSQDYNKKRDGKREYRERYIIDRRTGNQDPNSNNVKGDMFQELTCIWRSTISIIPVEDLNKNIDNYNSLIDHSKDSILGILQTKGKLYDSYNRFWLFGDVKNERFKEYDNMICYCANKDGTLIERIYVIPKKEIDERTSIGIFKNPSRGTWYEKYRITDENILIEINKLWKQIRAKKLNILTGRTVISG